jgi:uncharacterized protein DUF3857/transglutaminase superfamily protein
MQNLWCFARRTRRHRAKALQLAMIALLFTAAESFAGTPDWLRKAAQTPILAVADETDAVVLLDERLTTVSPAGEVRTTYRKAYKILRPEGRSNGTLYVYFDSETQLTFLKAWSITAQNTEYEVKEGQAVETGAYSEDLYGDTRYKVLQIPAALPGNVIGYEYQQRQRPLLYQAIWFFQDEIPVRHAHFTLELPPNWGYAAYWRNHAAVSPRSAGDNRWSWELDDIDPILPEKQMPAWRSVAGQFEVSFGPKVTAQPSSGYSSWTQVGQWYAQLTTNRREITPPIRTKVHELVSSATDPMERIRRLASYVQHGIRYVAIEIGIGGYQPHAATDVMAGGYGDCKDKATLLNAMLKEAGVDSYYVLINSQRDFIDTGFPSALGFNHVILAIRLPQELLVSEPFPIIHETLGSLLFFDPTDDSTPFGYLPPSLQSNYGLLVTDTGGELLHLPLSPPSSNRVVRTATFTLDQSGNLKGAVDEFRTGPAAAELRDRLLNLPSKQRQKVFQTLLSDFVDGAVLTGARLSALEQFTGTMVVSYDFTVDGYAQHAGSLFLFRNCVLGRKSTDLMEGKPRMQSVVFAHTASESDVIDISYPVEYAVDEMPQTVKYDYPFAAYKSEIHRTEHALHYTRTYELKDVRVPLERLQDLKQFFREIADDERAYAILKVP